MLGPAMTARIKDLCSLPGFRVDATQVRAFAKIAAITCPAQVFATAIAAVLPGYDVFNVERPIVRFIGQSAILAAPLSPPPDRFPRPFPHGLTGTFGEIASSLGLKHCNEVAGVDVVLVLGSLIVRQSSVISLGSELFHARRHQRIRTQANNLLGQFWGEEGRHRLEVPIEIALDGRHINSKTKPSTMDVASTAGIIQWWSDFAQRNRRLLQHFHDRSLDSVRPIRQNRA